MLHDLLRERAAAARPDPKAWAALLGEQGTAPVGDPADPPNIRRSLGVKIEIDSEPGITLPLILLLADPTLSTECRSSSRSRRGGSGEFLLLRAPRGGDRRPASGGRRLHASLDSREWGDAAGRSSRGLVKEEDVDQVEGVHAGADARRSSRPRPARRASALPARQEGRGSTRSASPGARFVQRFQSARPASVVPLEVAAQPTQAEPLADLRRSFSASPSTLEVRTPVHQVYVQASELRSPRSGDTSPFGLPCSPTRSCPAR